MIVFCLPQHRALLPADLDSGSSPAIGRFRLGRFSDGELWVELDDPVEGRDCAVLGSLAPPDEQMLATLLLAHTLRRAGARRVVALAPYLGYARQDRARPGRSLGAEWAGTLMQAVGVGGAIVPPLTGLLADITDLRTSLLLPAACYAVIAAYGVYARRPAA